MTKLAEDAHKGDAGRAFCVVGSRTMPGAAILVARAAQRAGAGLVSIGCLDDELLSVIPAAVPEPTFVDLSRFGESKRADVTSAVRAAHALLVGPGLGNTARTRAVVHEFVRLKLAAPRVFDADALNVLDTHPEALRKCAAPVVLTPHVGEATRLLSRPIPTDPSGRERAAKRLAVAADAIVVLKGQGSVITDGERVVVNETGNVGMATAGSGDVLAGILVAYLARRARVGGVTADDLFDCVVRAVRVHGRAGDRARDRLGADAVIASDLIDELPRAQRDEA